MGWLVNGSQINGTVRKERHRLSPGFKAIPSDTNSQTCFVSDWEPKVLITMVSVCLAFIVKASANSLVTYDR